LHIAFLTQELRKLAEKEAYANRILGESISVVLRKRLADLDAATNLKDIIVGSPSVADIAGEEVYTIHLVGNTQIVLRNNHPKKRAENSSKEDWLNLDRVIILSIGESQ